MATIPPPDPENPSIFTCSRLNDTTFVIQEDDLEYERPLIYVKLPRQIPTPICPVARFTKLRDYLENSSEPLNPGGQKKYIIICTHCHFDHIGGIAQFSPKNDDGSSSSSNDIIASAAGRDFAESDLLHHGLFHLVGKPAPSYPVTHWAQAFERLTHPLKATTPDVKPADLAITILHTPGHTPDQLAWYDHSENHLFVGDSMYFEGDEGMPVVWPEDGNWIEWRFSLQKMLCFVRAENFQAKALAGEGSSSGEKRVKLAAGHTTVAVDAEEFLELCDAFFLGVLKGEVPMTELADGRCLWRREEEEDGKSTAVSFGAPKRLFEQARGFFTGNLY